MKPIGRLRILQVVPTYFPAVRYGGPIRSVHGLAAGLARRGHDVQVYTTNVDHGGTLDVPVGTPVDVDGVTVTYFSVPALRRLYWSPAMARQLRQQIRSFDLVHLQSVYLWPTYAAARIAARANVPYVISPRGMLVEDLIRNRSRLVKTAWIEFIERRSLARSSGVHVTSELEATDLKQLGLEAPRVFCVANGVSWPEEITARASGPFAGVHAPYALFVGRICWKKGLDRLIRAWKWVPDLKLVIAGYDDENYRAKLEELARSENVTDRVEFVGAASDQHKWALYADAELFILPSYSENFGNVVAEAMAMRCPVVVTPEVGLSTVVRETCCGIVSDGEPRQLAGAIRELHTDAALRRAMGAAGRAAAVERLSWNAVASEMERIYESLRAPIIRSDTPFAAAQG